MVLPGEGVSKQAKHGRPDITAYLQAAAADGGAPLVGVFAGGPAGLMQTVHLAVAALNDRRGAGVYFELHNEVRGEALLARGCKYCACAVPGLPVLTGGLHLMPRLPHPTCRAWSCSRQAARPLMLPLYLFILFGLCALLLHLSPGC